MRKACSVFILVLVALHSANGQSDAKTDCSKLDFTDIPKDCCKTPFGSILPSDKMASTLKECKSTPKLLEWANSYKINSLQNQELKNFINLTDKNTVKELCSAGAFMECMFTKLSWINATGAIKINALSSALQAATTDTTWKDLVERTLVPMDPIWSNYYAFTDIVEDEYEKIVCPTGTVNLLPLIMAQMLNSEFIWMCPQQHIYNSKNKCAETMKNYQFCDGKIYSTNAKGVFFFPSV